MSETISRPRLGHSFSKPSRTDYGYRIGAHTDRLHYEWAVTLNDCTAPPNVLASGHSWTVSLAERDAELAVGGLPRIRESWPDGYAPPPIDAWLEAAWQGSGGDNDVGPSPDAPAQTSRSVAPSGPARVFTSLAFVPWTVAAAFLVLCIGDTIAGTPAIWGLLGWSIPLLAALGLLLWKEL